MFYVFAFYCLFSYCLGSVYFEIILTSIFGFKKNNHQSKDLEDNIKLSIKNKELALGSVFFILNFLKGLFPAIISYNSIGNNSYSIIALFAVIGHIFPVYLQFRGRKGIATFMGAILIINPLCFLLSFSIALLALYVFRIFSISALAFALGSIISFVIFGNTNDIIPITIIGLLVISSHSSDIRNILDGKEKMLETV